MSEVRLSLSAAVGIAVALSASGCFPLTGKLRQAGIRREVPQSRSLVSGPIIKAFSDGERVSIQYHTVDRSKERQRWINFDKAMLLRELPPELASQGQILGSVRYEKRKGLNVFTIHPGFFWRKLASRPRWDTSAMAELSPHRLPEGAAPREGPHLGVRFRDRVEKKIAESATQAEKEEVAKSTHRADAYLFMEIPETEGKDVIVVMLPGRTYRTAGGHLAQLLLPVTAAADVTVGPVVQGIAGLLMWRAWMRAR